MQGTTKTIAACALTALAVGGGTATAASLITGAQIKDGTIAARDVKKGTLTSNRLSAGLQSERVSVQKRLAALEDKAGISGPGGSNGSNGGTGAAGAKGDKGDKGADGGTGAPGAKGDKGEPAVTPVAGPGNGFTASNPSVQFGNDGVTYGPYTDNDSGGTLRFEGDLVKGAKLRDLSRVEYTATGSYSTPTGDAPYLRVFIDDDADGKADHDVIFSPSTQPGACAGPGGGAGSDQCRTSGRSVRYVVQDGTVRYDDDGGEGADVPFDKVIADHGTDTIMGVLVSTGFSLPTTTGGKLNSLLLELDGRKPVEFAFGS